jgi:NADH-quinone oxidoreductase subunit D
MTPTPETTSATPRVAGSRRVQEIFLGEGVPESGTENLVVNLGPSHPAMHGIVRIVTELDGERVVKTDVEIGYLHRAFEKECEIGPYNAAMPYTDRLNYVSPLINNFGFCSRRWRSSSASR